MPNKHQELDSALVAIVYAARDLVIEIEGDQGFHDNSLQLRLDDLRALVNEVCSLIEKINAEVEVQE